MITVYCDHSSARLNYILKVLFSEYLDIPYQIVHEITPTIHINYSTNRIENTFQIVPQGLLFENGISEKEVNVIKRTDNFKFSFFETDGTINFDVLSASFFLISRYEEYLSITRDNHDRYLAYNSIAYKNNFLEIPLVNSWFLELQHQLEHYFNRSIPFKTEFKIINTIDVDNAFAYKFKGFKRTTGAYVKNLLSFNFKEIRKRRAVLKGAVSDPYDTFEYLKNVVQDQSIETYFFILLGDFGGYDRNISHSNSSFVELLKSLSKWARLGIHPSYKSYLNSYQIEMEIKRLKVCINEPITSSRQHFLKLRLPDSYRILEQLGIKEDFTMGYAESYGFRGSICTPYSFYDLKNEKITQLTIRPFAYMDGTLNEYHHLTVVEAIEVIQELKQSVKEVNGHFIGIWHNDTVGDNLHWKGWKAVFEASLQS
jgi:hypothetical protein